MSLRGTLKALMICDLTVVSFVTASAQKFQKLLNALFKIVMGGADKGNS